MGRTVNDLNRRRSKLRDSDDDETNNKNGLWTREQLLAMDAKFCRAMRRAHKNLEIVRDDDEQAA